jgi:cytochrome c oxidase assembly factor CtaG
MSKPATLSKLIVISLLGALSLLLMEIRFEHREALGEAWQSWIPLLYCGAMLALGVAALTGWHRGGRQVFLSTVSLRALMRSGRSKDDRSSIEQ